MTNAIEFECALIRAQFTKKDLAKKLNISECGLYRKIKNLSEFKASEIKKLSELLGLDPEQQQSIFYS